MCNRQKRHGNQQPAKTQRQHKHKVNNDEQKYYQHSLHGGPFSQCEIPGIAINVNNIPNNVLPRFLKNHKIDFKLFIAFEMIGFLVQRLSHY